MPLRFSIGYTIGEKKDNYKTILKKAEEMLRENKRAYYASEEGRKFERRYTPQPTPIEKEKKE